MSTQRARGEGQVSKGGMWMRETRAREEREREEGERRGGNEKRRARKAVNFNIRTVYYCVPPVLV